MYVVQDQQDREETPELLELLDYQEDTALSVMLGPRDQGVHLDNLDTQDPFPVVDHVDLLDYQDIRDPLDLSVSLDCQEQEVI